MRCHFSFGAKRGNVLLVVLMVSAIVLYLIVQVFNWAVKRAQIEASAWKIALTEEVADGAISVMEAALERRLWEFPPVAVDDPDTPGDDRCMKSLTTSVTGSVPKGCILNANCTDYKVTADLEPSTNVVTIRSEATYKGTTSRLYRILRLDDAGQFLIASQSPQETIVSGDGTGALPSTFIAKDRRIFLKGSFTMSPSVARLNSTYLTSGETSSAFASSEYLPYPTTWNEYKNMTALSLDTAYRGRFVHDDWASNPDVTPNTWNAVPPFTTMQHSESYPLNMPRELAILVQSERTEFAGGINYDLDWRPAFWPGQPEMYAPLRYCHLVDTTSGVPLPALTAIAQYNNCVTRNQDAGTIGLRGGQWMSGFIWNQYDPYSTIPVTGGKGDLVGGPGVFGVGALSPWGDHYEYPYQASNMSVSPAERYFGTNIWGGFGYFTNSYLDAQQILNGFRNDTLRYVKDCGVTKCEASSSPAQDATHLNWKRIYPIALFGHTPDGSNKLHRPVKSVPGTPDDGQYWSNPREWASYWAHGIDGGGMVFNSTCIHREGSKRCADSNGFPNGFKAWRASAGLESSFYAGDATPMTTPTLSWENLDALKEDAAACGLVINSSTSSDFEDCSLVNNDDVAVPYLNNPGNPCWAVRKIPTENLDSDLARFTPSLYDDSILANKVYENRYLRRIIYAETPAQLAQIKARGLWVSQTNSRIRENLILWVVAEKSLMLKPYQFEGGTNEVGVQSGDVTDNGPYAAASIADDATRMAEASRYRETYLNEDLDPVNGIFQDDGRRGYPFVNPGHPRGSYLAGLKMVLLSPNVIEIVSPFHKNLTYAKLTARYPVSGPPGNRRIDATRSPLFDEDLEENDAFKWGLRNVNLNRMAVISSSARPLNRTFWLRGAWYAGPGQPWFAWEQACFAAPTLDSVKFTAAINAFNNLLNNPTDVTAFNNARTYGILTKKSPTTPGDDPTPVLAGDPVWGKVPNRRTALMFDTDHWPWLLDKMSDLLINSVPYKVIVPGGGISWLDETSFWQIHGIDAPPAMAPPGQQDRPASNSRFWNPTAKIRGVAGAENGYPPSWTPWVHLFQSEARKHLNLTTQFLPQVRFQGLRMVLDFDNAVPGGKFPLIKSPYQYPVGWDGEGINARFPGKLIFWSGGSYPRSPEVDNPSDPTQKLLLGVSCNKKLNSDDVVTDKWKNQGGNHLIDPSTEYQIRRNTGDYSYFQLIPDDNFKVLGIIQARSMPASGRSKAGP